MCQRNLHFALRRLANSPLPFSSPFLLSPLLYLIYIYINFYNKRPYIYLFKQEIIKQSGGRGEGGMVREGLGNDFLFLIG
jgi:hypothetical protein